MTDSAPNPSSPAAARPSAAGADARHTGPGAPSGPSSGPVSGRRIFQRLDQVNPSPYERRDYVRKLLWRLAYPLLIKWTPRQLLPWRRFVYQQFGAKLARGVNIRPSAFVWHPWLLTMGEYSCLADDVLVYNLGPLTIGDHTVISQRAHICNGTHDYRVPSLPLVRPTSHIGSGVWVCADAFVGPGVTIGDNTIVGAAAVVMRDLPEGVIAAGNPAVVVRTRPMGETPA